MPKRRLSETPPPQGGRHLWPAASVSPESALRRRTGGSSAPASGAVSARGTGNDAAKTQDLPQPVVETKHFPAQSASKLLSDIRAMIDSARNHAAHAVNTAQVLLYWNIGRRVRQDVLGNQRAGYGQRVVYTISVDLVREYGQGYTDRALFQMMRFSESFADADVVKHLTSHLRWSHFRLIMYMDDSLKRDFYGEMCRMERWSVRSLRSKIDGMLYERTALSRKPADLMKKELAALREEDRLTPDLVFKDPYFLPFLGLKGGYSEKDLEGAILRELEDFLVELGTDFTFVARQKRIIVGKKDRFLDLLFFHRRLRCLVAVELKLTDFEPSHMGQMEFYLRWLEKYEMCPGERPPIGLILCAGKEHEDVELLRLAKSGIRVAEYLTQLPPRQVLEKKLHDAIELARERLVEVKDQKAK